jgi:hypothetical protein
MKINETMEMAYPQKLARDILTGIADPINEHLVKLVAFQFDPQPRDHFKTELRSWLNKIQRIRLKPNARTGSFKFYFDPLFDYPFGGVEIHNTRALMEFISSEYDGIRPTISPEEPSLRRRCTIVKPCWVWFRNDPGVRRSQPAGARLFSSRGGETPPR